MIESYLLDSFRNPDIMKANCMCANKTINTYYNGHLLDKNWNLVENI